MKSNKFFDNDPVIINSKADSNFRVIKNLVKAENNLNLIQNRVKVLQLNENKNHSKLQNQIQLIEKIMKVRNNHAEDVEKVVFLI
jgi:3-polyprenyl-4-hydroxybenzoate decarboxylase